MNRLPGGYAAKPAKAPSTPPGHPRPPLSRPRTIRPISGRPCAHSIELFPTCDELGLRIAHAFSARPRLAERGCGELYARARCRRLCLRAADSEPQHPGAQVPPAPQLRQQRPPARRTTGRGGPGGRRRHSERGRGDSGKGGSGKGGGSASGGGGGDDGGTEGGDDGGTEGGAEGRSKQGSGGEGGGGDRCSDPLRSERDTKSDQYAAGARVLGGAGA